MYCICRSSDIDRFMIMCDQCEEWFHGNCIKISEKEAKYIKYFYCKSCQVKDPSLKTKYRKSKKKEEKEKKRLKEKLKKKNPQVHKSFSAPNLHDKGGKYEKDEAWTPKPAPRKISSHEPHIAVHSSEEGGSPAPYRFKDPESMEVGVDGCGECENCRRRADCGMCDTCFDRGKYGAAGGVGGCRLRRCLDDKFSGGVKPIKHEVDFEERFKKREKKLKKEKRRKQALQYASCDVNELDYDLNRQCLGPRCVKPALVSSKYCSVGCGRLLARNRLLQILPQRIQEWNATPTVANDNGRQELERIRKRMTQARTELQALEGKFHRLERIITTGRSMEVVDRQEQEEDAEVEIDQLIFCVVCGHSVSIRNAIKHMDKCYIKIESQMSFGSVYPTRIEGSQRLFCDVYNEQQQTYCKRLQILCPEHTKEPKVSESEVCGCPLSCDIYGRETPSKPSDFCRCSKRKCTRHFKWETMYRAEVDLQRIRQWLKIDEIFDEERRIKTAMSSRAGLVSLLLHQTTAHDPSCLDMRTKPTI
uniref:CXXC-type zinc finger protein 1 n=1 Tax=Ciona savignyi TaxID=51511 RepID=H2YGR2_CIOSA